MKTYIIEVQRVSYSTLEVEANNEDEARDAAFRDIEMRGDSSYADWDITLCEEKQQ